MKTRIVTKAKTLKSSTLSGSANHIVLGFKSSKVILGGGWYSKEFPVECDRPKLKLKNWYSIYDNLVPFDQI